MDGMASIKSRKRERKRIKSECVIFGLTLAVYMTQRRMDECVCVCVRHTSRAEALKTLLVTVLDG